MKVQAELIQVVVEREESKRAEAARLEAQRLEIERIHAERLEAERLERERLEAKRIEAERAEAENSGALVLAELEAKKAEAAGKASMISDPRVDNLEKSLEEIKAEQKMFKETLAQHTESQKET